MYNNKYIKTKIKIYDNRINTNFQDNKLPQGNECCTCLSVILLDSVVKIYNDHYPQIFLEQCRYAVKKLVNAINEEINLDESGDESNESDEY